MKAIIVSKKHRVCFYSLVLVPSIFLLIFFSCRKDEFRQPNEMEEGLTGSFLQSKGLSSVLYFPSATFTIVSKDSVDQKISLENKNYKYFENFIITVQNGNSGKTKVQQVEILIDGITVITTSDFRKNTSLVSKTILGLTQFSVLEVKLEGSKSRFISISIECSLKPDVISDIDGNYYHTVKIGDQRWMAENLKTPKYNNGELIGTTITPEQSIREEIAPKYQWSFRGREYTVDERGRYYTWFTVTDSRKVCPAGWHVPGDKEWKTLEMYLGMTQEQADQFGIRGTDQGTQMKSTFGWAEFFLGHNGTNTSGFTALPYGLRNSGGSFRGLFQDGWWWSSTETNEYAICRYLFNDEIVGVGRGETEKSFGLPVRCLKD